MKKKIKTIEILEPKNQLFLYNFENLFKKFILMHEKKNLPNVVLLSGIKGIGKSTFSYHFANYLLSRGENDTYSINKYKINEDNYTYKLINNATHPNFFSFDSNSISKEIKIEQIRNLITFLNKTTYSKDLKIVIIDNSERLNLNASNALLKSMEEPKENTFFFVIHDSSCKLLSTIKSRCIEFKIFQYYNEKKAIFNDLSAQYHINEKINQSFLSDLSFNSAGNVFSYFVQLTNDEFEPTDNILDLVFYFVDKYKKDSNPETLSFITFFINKYYNNLCSKKNKSHSSFMNYSKVFKSIDEMKKYNLNVKSVFMQINDILVNETR